LEAHPVLGTKIAIQTTHAAREGLRSAVLRLAAGSAGPGGVVVDVVDDDKVEPAVLVVVEESGRRAPGGVVQAGFPGHLDEFPLALVEEQADAAILGTQVIGTAIVVDIANGHAHTVAGDIEARPR